MKIKCPECEAVMVEQEEEHVCESCDHTISLDEADELFEDGKLVVIAEEGEADPPKKKDDEDKKDEDENVEESFNGFENKETWASTVITENEYSLLKQIRTAHKANKLDEKFVQTLVENASKAEKTSAEFDGVDLDDVSWDQVTEHFQGSMKTSEEIEVDVTKVLFAESELDEAQKDELTNIFETAVDIRVNEIKAGLLESNQQKLDEAIEDKEKELEDATSDYIDHVVSEWYEDNKLVIEDSLKVEYASDFVDRLHDLFLEHYVHVPEDRYDIIESLNEKVKQYEDYEVYALKENEELEETITEMKKEKALTILMDGMIETEKEKLNIIAEKVDYKDEESFVSEVTTLKEAFISKENVTDTKVDKSKNEDKKPSIYDDIAAASML